MALDFTKLPVDIVVDQINADNHSSLVSANLTFGLPTAATGANPARDTEVTVTAVQGSGYTGSVVLQYNRVDMATIPGTLGKSFPVGSATKISDMIPAINAKYKINIQAEDYTDGALPAFTGAPNETLDVQLAASANSLVWKGSLIFQITANDIPLGTVIVNPVLNGLVYTPPTA